MSPKTKKDAQLVIRITLRERLALDKDAAAVGLDLTAYLRYLLHTHPDRAHNKAKGAKAR